DVMVREGRQMQEAHLAGFVDDIDTDVLASRSFERISDDEESEAAVTAARRGRKATSSAEGGKKKRTRSSGATKSAAKKKTSSKRSKKAAGVEETREDYGDAEAAVGESHSRAEFATRRGGRRRRRSSSKSKQTGQTQSVEETKSGANGADDDHE